MFVIMDTVHWEQWKQFSSLGDTLQELQRLALLPWDAHPNLTPCVIRPGRPNCGRIWAIFEYDTSTRPWQKVAEQEYLDISSRGVRWLRLIEPDDP